MHAIVLTGAGGHFCSGGDITEMAPPDQPVDPVLGRRRLGILHDVMRLQHSPPHLRNQNEAPMQSIMSKATMKDPL